MSASVNATETTELEVLFEWARAEVHEWEPKEPRAARLLSSDEAQTDAAKHCIVNAFRRGIPRRDAAIQRLAEITKGNARWYEADFRVEALGRVALHPHWGRALQEWRRQNGLRACGAVVEEFAKYPMERGFRLRHEDPRTYRPIFISQNLEGPWRIAEGSHRCDALWKLSLTDAPQHKLPFKVFLGVHARMNEWSA